DAAPCPEVVAHDIVAGDAGRAARRLEQGGEQMDGGGLPGAVGPEEAEELGLVYGEAEVVEGAERAEVRGEAARLDGRAGPPYAGRTGRARASPTRRGGG